IEGPQFSTRAESRLYQAWGASVIGMTSLPEAKLAREAELCYAGITMVTDWDSWHPEHDHVTVEQVLSVMARNVTGAREIVRLVTPRLAGRTVPCAQRCDRALDGAVMTAPEGRDPGMVAHLSAVAGRVL
ncbi:MAG TPA: hypothetical protein VFU23_00740, partial [Gemmatimonadales bacterium]|nr:hypothetical protein [Gemmatimonadales bacterium]